MKRTERGLKIACILVIDDEEELRIALRGILEHAGYQVVDAPDGMEGISRYRQQPADVVIVDIVMPEKDGLEVIRELKRDFPDAKIIAMSANPTYLSLAIDLGALCAITKPFGLQKLVNMVRDLTGLTQ